MCRARHDSRRAISYHYDVSNEFYGLWLDQRRIYSCAYFRCPDDSLDVAQEQRLEHVCRKLDQKENEAFLDIGCGWGGLVLWAAECHGVMADGITLSQSQYDYVREQIRVRGLESCCRVRLMDYRDLPEIEAFDKIASIGMFEHVGRKNFPAYFGKIYRLLKPGGLILNHGITTVRLDGGDLGSDLGAFIDQYVFPGGDLVHVSAVTEALSRHKQECWNACVRTMQKPCGIGSIAWRPSRTRLVPWSAKPGSVSGGLTWRVPHMLSNGVGCPCSRCLPPNRWRAVPCLTH